VPAERVGDGVGGETSTQELLEDLAAPVGRKPGRHPLPEQDAGDAIGFVFGRDVAGQGLRKVAVDPACFELSGDPQTTPSFDPVRRPDVRGADPAIIQRAIGDERRDDRVGFLFVVFPGEKPLAKLGARVIAAAEKQERRRAGGRPWRAFQPFRRATSEAIGISTGVSQPCRSGVAPVT
jgi:hypothetical protein